MSPLASLRAQIRRAREVYRISPAFSAAIIVLPWIAAIVMGILLTVPSTRGLGRFLILEDHPIEDASFAAFFIGGILGLMLGCQARRHGGSRWLAAYYTAAGVFLLACAMEEISWGQRIFGWKTPGAFKESNIQVETNIHNLPILDNLQDYLLIAFSLAGIWSTRLFSRPRVRAFSAPGLLISTFIVILIACGLDLVLFEGPSGQILNRLFSELSEPVEMLFAFAGLLHVWLNRRMLAAEWKGRAAAGGIFSRQAAGGPV